MSENTALWDKLGKTDPGATKKFVRGGGFRGTAIKPMWSIRRMTEEFGPCGKGWGFDEPLFRLQEHGDEVLVFCTIQLWWETRDQTVTGVGGDKVFTAKGGDDEAFKKAFTDALANAMKFIGVGADVHMGRFDDSKYVKEMEAEFSEKSREELIAEVPDAQVKDSWQKPRAPLPPPPRKENGLPQKGYSEDGARTAYALKNEQPDLWPEMMQEVAGMTTVAGLEHLWRAWNGLSVRDKFPANWHQEMVQVFKDRKAEIVAQIEAMDDPERSQLSAAEQFKASVAALPRLNDDDPTILMAG